MKKSKIVMIGVDGASWKEMLPLINEGALPNFNFLIEKGVHGTLESIDPPYTPIVWTTISSGKNPEKHGVYNVTPTRHNVKTLRIWDIIEECGGSIGLFSWPVTWPPRETRGFIVPGSFAMSADTFPQDLSYIPKISEIDIKGRLSLQHLTLLGKIVESGVRIRTLKGLFTYLLKSRFMRKELNEVQRQIVGQSLLTDIYVNLHRKFRPFFSAFYLSAIDTAAHLTWKYFEPVKFGRQFDKEVRSYGQLIPASYKNTDECIGRILLKCVDKETALIIASDHGTKAATEGETIFKIKAEKLFEKLEIQRRVDYFYSEQGVYLSTKSGFRNEEIMDTIRQVRLSETNEAVFHVSESSIKGLYSIRCNDNIIAASESLNSPIELKDSSYCALSEIVQRDEYMKSGIHDKNGIFIACGSGIKKCEQVNMQVADLVPTMLYYLGLPLGKDFDGQVRFPMFEESFRDENPIRYIQTYDSKERKKKYLLSEDRGPEILPEKLEERLRTLGYI